MIAILITATACQITSNTVLDDKGRDAKFFRWVIEAKKQADHWAFEEPHRMFPQKTLRRLSLVDQQQFRRMLAMREHAASVLKEAAYRQICEAYDISMKEFRAIIANRDVARLRHDHEKFRNTNGQRVGMATTFGGLEPTRFDPSKVKLPKPYGRIAGRSSGSTTPKPPKVFSDEAESRGAGKSD